MHAPTAVSRSHSHPPACQLPWLQERLGIATQMVFSLLAMAWSACFSPPSPLCPASHYTYILSAALPVYPAIMYH